MPGSIVEPSDADRNCLAVSDREVAREIGGSVDFTDCENYIVEGQIERVKPVMCEAGNAEFGKIDSSTVVDQLRPAKESMAT